MVRSLLILNSKPPEDVNVWFFEKINWKFKSVTLNKRTYKISAAVKIIMLLKTFLAAAEEVFDAWTGLLSPGKMVTLFWQLRKHNCGGSCPRMRQV